MLTILDLAAQSADKQNQSLVPLAPSGPPLLIPVGISQILIDLSGAVPQVPDCESANRNDTLPVVFLFKFEDVNSDNVLYNWTVGHAYARQLRIISDMSVLHAIVFHVSSIGESFC